MPRLALCATVAFLLGVAALPAASGARVPDASTAAACSKETKRLKTFQRGMKAAKRRFFRAHRGAKARKRFVRQQKQRLAKLRRARRRCLASPPAAGVPAPPVVPNPPAASPIPPPAPAPAPSPPAREGIADVASAAAVVAPGEQSVENGVEYVRTQIELELEDDASAAEMEALLDRLDGEVVSSLEGVGLLTVRIPDPGSLDALRALVAGLAGAPGLAHADLLTLPVPAALPDNVDPADVSPVRAQLASKAAAAWNARSALKDAAPPSLLVGDYFGAGPPGPAVAGTTTATDFLAGDPHFHGYLILGLAAGAFEPGAVAGLAADQVTGMWAGPPLPLRVVDLQRRVAGSTVEDRLLQMVAAMPGDVVLNTSFADGCSVAGCTAAVIERDARQWIERVRGRDLEGRFLHVSAAGNLYPNLLSDTDATLGSRFNAAAVRPMAGVNNLSNTLVVENTTSSKPAAGPVAPLCLTASSKVGGQLSAVGNDVTSLSGPGTAQVLAAGGTSSAAPQVAGAAATLWALDPQLTPAQLAGRLTGTTGPVTGTSGDPRCGARQAAPALDAYAATLGADNAARSPARDAILDPVDGTGSEAAGNGRFDEQDLAAFLAAFQASQVGGADLDYGRYDLNGDGFTGGTRRTRMDLDATQPVAWGFSRRNEVLGLAVGHDESAVRDIDVLCHEAHGDRYVGAEAPRDEFAAELCLPAIDIQADPAFPTALAVGASAPLRIRARRTAITDPAVSQQPGVRLELSVSGGSLDRVTGVTGEDGALTAMVTRTDPGTDVIVTVVARAGEGGPQLDDLTVRAGNGVSITLLQRLTSSNSNCLVNAPGDLGNVHDSARDEKEIDQIAAGRVVATTAAAASVSPSGGSATCSGGASIDSTLTEGAGTATLDFDGATSGNSNASVTVDDGSAGASTSVSGGHLIRFSILGGQRRFTATGTFTSSLGGSGSSAFAGSARLWLETPQGPAYFMHYDRSGDHNTSSSVPSALSQTGVLGPGTYQLSVSLLCLASANENVDSQAGTANCASDGDFKLTLGPP